MCKGKYTINVDGKVSKCDSADDNIHIGNLDTNGNLVLSGTYEEDWMTGCFKYKEECEDCFFSAVCFKGTCPICNATACESKCKLSPKQIDSLIKLYLNSNDALEI